MKNKDQMKLVMQQTPSVIYGYMNEEEMLYIGLRYPFYWLIQPGIRTRPTIGDIINGVIESYNQAMYMKQRFELGFPPEDNNDEDDPGPTVWIIT